MKGKIMQEKQGHDNRSTALPHIEYIHEPTDLQCGQAVLAMITGLTAERVARELGNDRETSLKEMKSFLRSHDVWISDIRIQAAKKEELPAFCMLSLETPRCWHWSLYCKGFFYDPEHGILDDFPESARRYYWEIRPAQSRDQAGL